MRLGSLKLKLQLVCGEAVALGPGKADLLDAIAREGSISAAARSMAMSYRRAWLLVDEMNRCFVDRLVETAPGGGAQGGARLTPLGQEMLAAYRALDAHTADIAADAAYARISAALRDAPAG